MVEEKDEIIIRSIKKLLSLKLTDDEIIENLLDAGLDYDYAGKLLQSVKNEKASAYSPNLDNKPSSTPVKKIDAKVGAGVWQEGVLTIVNQKLEEISAITENIDSVIKKEANTIVAKEVEKIKVVLDSQRSLLVSKINNTLAETTMLANKKVEEKLGEIVGVEERIEKRLADLTMNYRQLNEIKNSISAQIEDFPKIKEDLLSQFEQDMSKYNGVYDSTLKKYEQKLKEVDTKLNNTISLATKIVESLVETTKKKIDAFIKEKTNAQIAGIEDKLKELEAAKSRMIKEIAKFEALREEYESKFKVDLETSIANYLNNNMDKIIALVVQKSADEGLETFKLQTGSLVKKLQKDVIDLKEDFINYKSTNKSKKQVVESKTVQKKGNSK